MKIYCAILALAGPWLIANIAAQSSASNISFQGALTRTDGKPLANGNYNLTFKFYNVPTGGTALATSNVPNVPVTGGLASAPIPVDAAWFNGQTRYLGITLSGEMELSPRVLVTRVPYSLYSHSTRGVEFDSGGRIGLGRDPFPNDNVAVNGIVSAGPTVGEFAFRGAYSDGVNYDYNGRQVAFYRLLGGASSGAGFGVVISTNDGGSIASPMVWMMNQPNNSFDVRSQLAQGGLPGNVLFSVNASGETQCGTSTQPGQLSVFGDEGNVVFQTKRSGTTMVRVLQITGGSDLAESFEVTRQSNGKLIEAGMVMVIDREHDGRLLPCTDAYDSAVAGVISGANGLAPGMVMRADDQPLATGSHPLAMTGRVYCWVDATELTGNGPVRRGDRLTTSRTVGHAMKAINRCESTCVLDGIVDNQRHATREDQENRGDGARAAAL